MLERQSFQENRPDEDQGQSLSPSYFYAILKRRALYFVIPFLLISTIGSLITAAWPSRYLSQGTILVSSQEIPADLVRPTVAALANDRIQIIQQRIMTRDNLLAIAKKYQLSAGWQERMSGTELVDFIRERTQIKAVEDKMLAGSSEGGQRKNAIAFKVGFEYEKPQIAMRIANEFVTMILNEDVRSRTEFAKQTTKFLQQEVTRLEAKLGLINSQITQFKQLHAVALTDTSKVNDSKDLALLKAELVLKSASYSDEHPDIRALKRKIGALEKTMTSTNANQEASQKTTVVADPSEIGLDTLETQRIGLRDELNRATQKASAARLGENMERDQQSERLEVIEQPTFPENSTKPNKPKLYAVIFALALMAGGGLLVAAEALDHAIRRSTDLFSVIDSQLIFAIPYISTPGEILRRKRKMLWTTGILTLVILAGLIAIVFILPPLDVLLDKVIARLSR